MSLAEAVQVRLATLRHDAIEDGTPIADAVFDEVVHFCRTTDWQEMPSITADPDGVVHVRWSGPGGSLHRAFPPHSAGKA